MEITYFPNGTICEKQQKDIDIINHLCLSNKDADPEVDMYDWEAPQDGKFLLLDGERVVGRVSVHITTTKYDGQEYCLGGFGGLAVLSQYRGHGYGRKLAEAALQKASELGVDVACMCVNMTSGITDLYQKLGYQFLNRPAYFINWIDKEKTDDTVMIKGINNPELAEKILHTDNRFHYGQNKGHW